MTGRRIWPVLFLGTCWLLAGCDTESTVTPRFDKFFVKYYGETGDQYGADIKATSDGGFIIVGTTDPDKSMDGVGESGANGDEDIIVIKTDALGNEEWSRTIDASTRVDEGRSVVEMPNGAGFLVGGNYDRGTNTDMVLYHLAVDSSILAGPILFDNTADERCGAITILADGYLVAGNTTFARQEPGPAFDLQDFYTIKLDFNLVEDPTWAPNKVVGRDGVDVGIQAYADPLDPTQLVTFGYTDQPEKDATVYQGLTFTSFLFRGSASDGDDYYGDLRDQSANSVYQTNEGFMMTGTVDNGGLPSMYFVRLNGLNPIIETEVFVGGDPIQGRAVTQTIDNSALFAGQIIYPTGNRDIFLGRTNFNGVTDWARTFGDSGQDDAAQVIQIADGSILLLGTMNISGQHKIALIKTNSEGEMKL